MRFLKSAQKIGPLKAIKIKSTQGTNILLPSAIVEKKPDRYNLYIKFGKKGHFGEN